MNTLIIAMSDDYLVTVNADRNEAAGEVLKVRNNAGSLIESEAQGMCLL